MIKPVSNKPQIRSNRFVVLGKGAGGWEKKKELKPLETRKNSPAIDKAFSLRRSTSSPGIAWSFMIEYPWLRDPAANSLRQFLPNMWKSIVVDRKSRFIKYEREEDLHKVYLSDTVNVWMEGLTSSNLSKRCKEMNSLVEAEPEELAKHVCTLIGDNGEDTCITGSEEGEMRVIHIESKLAGIPFYFTFRMEKMNSDVFCKQLTIPLMLLVVQQQSRLAQLQTMLIAKDSEIEQYKLEGAILKKRKVETQPFLQSGLTQNEPEECNVIDAPDSIDLFKKLFHLLPTISASIEKPLKKELNDKRTMDLIQSEPEEKCEAIPFITSNEVASAKEEKSTTEAPNSSQPQVGKSKKIKLRI